MKRMLFPIIKKYLKLLISIMLVSAMGCGIMTGLSSAYVSLETSLDNYVDDYNYPDAVITTDVTNRKKIDKLKELQSVSEINARLCGDTYIKSKEGRYLSVRVFSYNPDDMQKFHIWSQRDSNGRDDIFLEYNFAEDNGIKAGSTVSVKVGESYRDYFVSGIVTMPETLSVQPTDDSWGVNTDFGYAYAPVRLLKDGYDKKYNEVKEELDDKQSELDKEWDKAQKELEEAESKLNEAKKQLAEKEQLFRDSSVEAEDKLTQLVQAEAELQAMKAELENKRKQLAETKQTLQNTISEIKGNKDKLIQAVSGLEQIDDALKDIDNITELMSKGESAGFLGMLEAFPKADLSYIFDRAEDIQNFVDILQEYGFSYDLTDEVTDFSKRLINYMDKAESDYIYINSDKINNLSDEEIIKIVKRYSIYNPNKSIEENIGNAREVLGFIHDIAEEKNLYSTVSYLPMIGSDKKLQALLSDIEDMGNIVSQLTDYTGQSVKTAEDLTKAYKGLASEIEQQKEALTAQRKQITDTLAEYGLTEDDIDDAPAMIEEKLYEAENGIIQIDDGIRQIDEGLPEIESKLSEITEGKEKIISELDSAEKKLSDAKKEISENQKKFDDETAKALSEFENLQEELEKAYNELEDGEGYDMLCNQFLVYFEDGSDSTAELEKLKKILEDETINIKSSFTYEDSAVKKRIDVNLEPIETMSVFMPMIFFVIILIVVFLFMSLIVKQSRREIGILRALGFTKTSIKLLFCGVDLIVSLGSVVLGSVIGYGLLRYVCDYYKAFFPLPEFTFKVNIGMYLFAAVLTIVTGQISTLISTGTISKIMPSEAMSRPAPETADVPKLIQRLTAHASPMTKFSVATMLRNKMRFVFSVICISASVMMIFSSLAFITSKNYLLHQLYDERIHYDCQIFFKEEPTDDFIKEMNELKFVREAQKMPYYQADISFNGKTESGVINALDRNTQLVGVYDRYDKKLDIPEQGIILEKHLAEEIGADVGDTVDINGVSVKIAEISDQSISRFHYISYEAAEKLGDVSLGSVICNISQDDEQKLLEFLTENDNYLYAVFTRLAHQGNEKIFKTYDLAAWIIIGFAIIIGLVIVINTAQTNLLEKKRELCVLRTLGFQHSEISRKWFVQSFLQFVLSCIVGLPTGIYIAQIGLQKLSTEGREYVFANSFNEYIFTILLVLAYMIVSHFIAMNSMKKWDMVESVKDKE